MRSEKFYYIYRNPDDVKGPSTDEHVALLAVNSFMVNLKLRGRAREADPALWSGKVLKQERTGKLYAATIIFTRK